MNPEITYLYQMVLAVSPDFSWLDIDQYAKKKAFLELLPKHEPCYDDLNNFFSSHQHLHHSLFAAFMRTHKEAKQMGRKWAKLFYDASPNTPFHILTIERNIQMGVDITQFGCNIQSPLKEMEALQRTIKGAKFDNCILHKDDHNTHIRFHFGTEVKGTGGKSHKAAETLRQWWHKRNESMISIDGRMNELQVIYSYQEEQERRLRAAAGSHVGKAKQKL